MKSYIGTKEASASVILFSLSPAFLALIGTVCTSLATGAILSVLISALIFLVFLIPLKIYLKKSQSNSIIILSQNYLGKNISTVLTLILSFLVFSTASVGFSAFCENISSLSSFSLSKEKICFVLLLSSCICALSGIESLTRKSYIVFLSSVVIVGLLVLTTVNGINKDNLYPIFGTEFKKTFINYDFVGLGVGLGPLLLISDRIKKRENGKREIISAYLWIFIITLIMVLVYIFTVPYPMGRIFNSSLEAVFASASSGEILHRFELFLLILFAFLAIESSSLCLYCVSYVFSQLTHANDTKPFVLVLTPVIFFMSDKAFSNSVYIMLCNATALYSIGLIIFILSVIRFREKI